MDSKSKAILSKPVKTLSFMGASVLLLAVVTIIIVVILRSDTKSSSVTSSKTYLLPEDRKVYAISTEAVAGELGSFLTMGSNNMVMSNANWCAQNNQNFKFIKLASGTTDDRTRYRIMCCDNGFYLTASMSGGVYTLKGDYLDVNSKAQIWDVVATANQTSIHNYPLPTGTSTAETLGVVAIISNLYSLNLAYATLPTLTTTNYESDVKQRWSLQEVLCDVSCNL
jgi:hypothetical protein